MKTVTFENYLTRYKGQFRNNVVHKADDGTYNIHGKFAMIGPYDPENGKLGLWYIANPKLKISTRRRNIILAALVEQNLHHYIHQDCDVEFGLIFDEQDVDKVAEIIKAHRKRKISSKRSAQLKAQANSMLNAKKNLDRRAIKESKSNDNDLMYRPGASGAKSA